MNTNHSIYTHCKRKPISNFKHIRKVHTLSKMYNHPENVPTKKNYTNPLNLHQTS